MKNYLLDRNFHTDTRSEAKERERVNILSRQFYRIVKSRNHHHQFFSLTLTPKERFVRNFIGWYDDSSRERYIHDLYGFILHRFSRNCCSNYRRKIHEDRQLISLGFIEHYSKDMSKRVPPHIHAILAVNDYWLEKFESCLDKNACLNHYHFSSSLFTDQFAQQRQQEIASSKISHLSTMKDQYRWIAYASKHQDEDYEPGSSLYSTVPRRKKNSFKTRSLVEPQRQSNLQADIEPKELQHGLWQ